MSTAATQPIPQTGAGLLVKSLEAQGVEYIFGIPGAKIDKVFDTLLDSKIKTVVCRHEQNAAFIAAGIGRMTGKAGVALDLRAGLLEPGHRPRDCELGR
jgi:acetolactate synthase-1/2/3 large subunit